MEPKETKKVKNLKLKEVNNQSIEDEVQGIMNVIKNDQIQNGNIPRTSPIAVMNFAGKVLNKCKSVYMNCNQYFLNAGTAWEDIDAFHRKHISFSESDFDNKKGD